MTSDVTTHPQPYHIRIGYASTGTWSASARDVYTTVYTRYLHSWKVTKKLAPVKIETNVKDAFPFMFTVQVYEKTDIKQFCCLAIMVLLFEVTYLKYSVLPNCKTTSHEDNCVSKKKPADHDIM